jgi:hypothetical protein
VSAAPATAPTSSGSIVATGTFANGALTMSPARSCGIQSNVFDMKLLGWRKVQGRPDLRTASSATMW